MPFGCTKSSVARALPPVLLGPVIRPCLRQAGEVTRFLSCARSLRSGPRSGGTPGLPALPTANRWEHLQSPCHRCSPAPIPLDSPHPLATPVLPCENKELGIAPGFLTYASHPTSAISSRGLGRRPLTAETRVRIPVSLPTISNPLAFPDSLPAVGLPLVYFRRMICRGPQYWVPRRTRESKTTSA